MNRKIKVLIVCLLPALVALTTMAFTFGTAKPIKLTSAEIQSIKNMVNEYYDYSNCVASDLPTSPQCIDQLLVSCFGGYDNRGCRIYNDFMSSSSMRDQLVSNGYFRDYDSYIMALRNTHVQTTLESINPYGGEWTKVLAPKTFSSDPDVYKVTVNVKKRFKNNTSSLGNLLNQSISIALYESKIVFSGIHPEAVSSSSVSSSSSVTPGNYMALALEYYANKDYKEALAMFEKQIAFCQDPEAYYYAAVMYYKNQGCRGMGYTARYQKYIECLKKVANSGSGIYSYRARFTLVREGIE